MALEQIAPMLGNLPSRRPELFSQYNHELSGRKVALRFAVARPGVQPQPPTVVRSEGTSVLVRELEKAHLRKTSNGNKRASAQAAALQRKQARRGQQQHVAPQGDEQQQPQQQQAQQQPVQQPVQQQAQQQRQQPARGGAAAEGGAGP